MGDLYQCAASNNRGIDLEKAGLLDEAICEYEANIVGDCNPACHSFDRLMGNNYWSVINLLLSCIENDKVDADELKKARLSLSTELDKRSVCNLPTDETKRLLSVLDGLYGKVSDNE